jgi:catechol 2,3-dioxygenase-like lactoylglutathione lyase family enzyme
MTQPTEPDRPVRRLRMVVEADDYEEAVAFYRDVLGLPEVASFDAEERTGRLVEHGARLVAPPTETPWRSINAGLDAPAGLPITVFQELTSLDERERMAGSGADGET